MPLLKELKTRPGKEDRAAWIPPLGILSAQDYFQLYTLNPTWVDWICQTKQNLKLSPIPTECQANPGWVPYPYQTWYRCRHIQYNKYRKMAESYLSNHHCPMN